MDYVSFYDAPAPADPQLVKPEVLAPISQGSAYAASIAQQSNVDPEEAQGDVDQLTRLFTASRQATAYDGVGQGRVNALADAFDNRAKGIAAETGATVDNPYRQPPLTGFEADDPSASPLRREASRMLLRDELVNYHPGEMLNPYDPYVVQRGQELMHIASQKQFSDLAQQFPDKADIIGADRSIEDDAKSLTQGALNEFGAAKAAAPGLVAPLVSEFAGGAIGALRDPVLPASLVIGGGESLVAKSLFGRVAEAGLRSAAANAGIQALQEPQVQQWRADRGQESGFLPAAEDIGWAALFGAIPGAGIEAARIGIHGLSHPQIVETLEKAASGDPEAAATAASFFPQDTGLAAHVEAERLDREAVPPPPEGVSADDRGQAYVQAVRHAEDPSEPLPELPPKIGNDGLALETIKEAKSPMEAAEALRDDPLALTPEDYDRRIEQRAYALDPESYDRAGVIENQIGSARRQLSELLDQKSQLMRKSSGAPLADDRLASLQGDLDQITGKRRSSPRAQALRDEIERLKTQSAGVDLSTLDRLSSDEQLLRLNISNMTMDRGRLGPMINAARQRAVAEAEAIGVTTQPRAVTSAMASDNPGLRQLGRVASLGNDAFQLLREGRADPAVAAEVAARVKPAEQASVLAAVTKQKPRTKTIAARLVSEELDARATPAAQAHVLGSNTALDRVPQVEERGLAEQTAALQEELGSEPVQTPKANRAAAARKRGPQSLLGFLRQAGGLQDDGGELAARDMRKRFPGLVRKNGLPLDRAREMAAEAGYLGADTDRAMGETGVNDLLEALDKHPVYSVHDQDAVLAETEKTAAKAEAARYDGAAEMIRREHEAFARENDLPTEIDPELVRDAAPLVADEGMQWDDALHAAAMRADDLRATPEDALNETRDEIPFDDVPPTGRGKKKGSGGDDGGGGSETGLPPSPRGPDGPLGGDRGGTGSQGELPGTERISDAELAQRRAGRGLTPGVEQDLDTAGLPLFGDQKDQADLLDLVPVADRADGADTRLVPREDLLNAEPRETLLADIIEHCPLF